MVMGRFWHGPILLWAEMAQNRKPLPRLRCRARTAEPEIYFRISFVVKTLQRQSMNFMLTTRIYPGVQAESLERRTTGLPRMIHMLFFY